MIGHCPSRRGPARAREKEKSEKKRKRERKESVAVIHESFGPLTAIFSSLGRESPPLTGLNST